jgi:hypothetical protein
MRDKINFVITSGLLLERGEEKRWIETEKQEE